MSRERTGVFLRPDIPPLLYAALPVECSVCFLGSRERDEARLHCARVGFDRLSGMGNTPSLTDRWAPRSAVFQASALEPWW
jgi:hypothetical protein